MIIRGLLIALVCALLFWYGKGLVDGATASLATTFWWMRP